MKRKAIGILLAAMFLVMLFPVTAQADAGPKPSVHVLFKNMGDELCYGTLLSERNSNGPNSAWDGLDEHIYNYDLDPEIWRAFVEYEDADGYYFLQTGWEVSETKEIPWTYHPPDPFKILLYYPETDTFAVSGIYERYAFDSYYTVDMAGVDNSTAPQLTAYKSYNFTWELISLVARLVVTVLIEIAIALLFGYRAKKQLTLIVGVNVVTQVLLNVLLNIINYNSGPLAFVIFYVFLELLVFFIEAIIFYRRLHKITDKNQKQWLAILYALVANAASFAAGLWLAIHIPGIF